MNLKLELQPVYDRLLITLDKNYFFNNSAEEVPFLPKIKMSFDSLKIIGAKFLGCEHKSYY